MRHRQKGFVRLVPPVFGVALLLVVLSCGGETGPAGEAPDFPIALYQGAEELGGGDLKLSDLRGQAVVLNFWAGLCPPCRAEMPDFQDFYTDYRGRATVIGVDVGRFTQLGSREDAKSLLAELGVTYPAGYTKHDGVIADYGVLSMPTTVFIDRSGDVFRKWAGVLDRDTLERITNEMLSQPSIQ